MAYTITPPPPPSNANNREGNIGNTPPTGKPPMTSPFVEEVEPTPSPILGDIKFQKTIYSQNAFRKKVDVSISELKPQSPPIDIQGFFKQYRKLFFDIPKEGIISHGTLIRESRDYYKDFIDPKDEQILDLEGQVESLNNRINNHIIGTEIIESAGGTVDSIGDAIEEQTEVIEEQAENAAVLLEIGNPNDPNIYWSKNSARLLFPDGLKEVGKHMIKGNSQRLPNGQDAFEGNKNKIDDSYRDLKEAYNKGGNSNIRELQEIRTYSEWNADIKKRAGGSGTKRYRNCIDCLNYVRFLTLTTLGSIINQ
jgi:hypothetical protein